MDLTVASRFSIWCLVYMSDWSGRRLKDLISYTRQNAPDPTLRPTMTSSLSNGAIKSSGACTSFLPQKSSLELRLPCLSSFDGELQFLLVWLLIGSMLLLLIQNYGNNQDDVKLMLFQWSSVWSAVYAKVSASMPSRLRHSDMLSSAEQLPKKLSRGRTTEHLFWRPVEGDFVLNRPISTWADGGKCLNMTPILQGRSDDAAEQLPNHDSLFWGRCWSLRNLEGTVAESGTTEDRSRMLSRKRARNLIPIFLEPSEKAGSIVNE